MRKHWFTFPAVCLMLSIAPARGQGEDNLIYNPSFEEYVRCPQKIDATGVMTEAEAWWQPTKGSSDYFNSCGNRECSVPRNKMGLQPAHSGEAYCGIYCSQEQYREYLQTELKAPLLAGKRYRIAFWTSLAEKSPYAAATLGALLTKQRVEDSTHGILMQREMKDSEDGSLSIAQYFEPQMVNNSDSVLDNTRIWVEVSGEFVAKGGERFLTIGNFFSFNKSHVVLTKGSHTPLPGAYYYIDDVSLTCLDSLAVHQPPAVHVPMVGEVVRIENLLFATGESEVLPQSYADLMRLKRLLEENPTMKIELHGHTDGQGTIDYNQRLSEDRARAVARYLTDRGIERSRIVWKGFGKQQPIANNSTPEGRQTNRRVEYVVTER